MNRKKVQERKLFLNDFKTERKWFLNDFKKWTKKGRWIKIIFEWFKNEQKRVYERKLTLNDFKSEQKWFLNDFKSEQKNVGDFFLFLNGNYLWTILKVNRKSGGTETCFERF